MIHKAVSFRKAQATIHHYQVIISSPVNCENVGFNGEKVGPQPSFYRNQKRFLSQRLSILRRFFTVFALAIIVFFRYNKGNPFPEFGQHRERVYDKMSEEFGPTFITVTDEDGKELVLEFVDALEYNGQMYQAFFPAETEGEKRGRSRQRSW